MVGAAEELQELSRGIHPAIDSRGGLGPALRTLARRSTVPVELDLESDTRLPEPIEVAAYFVASEAMANTAKHAHASRIDLALATVTAHSCCRSATTASAGQIRRGVRASSASPTEWRLSEDRSRFAVGRGTGPRSLPYCHSSRSVSPTPTAPTCTAGRIRRLRSRFRAAVVSSVVAGPGHAAVAR